MKKFFALLIAFAMIAVLGVPAFADNAEPIFNTVFTRVENEPTVEYDEWEIPYNVWTPMENSAPVAIGDTVTMRISYTVPSETEDFDERAFGAGPDGENRDRFDRRVPVRAVPAVGARGSREPARRSRISRPPY